MGELITQDNIKNELCLYTSNMYIKNQKWKYVLSNQRAMLKELSQAEYIKPEDIINKIYQQVNIGLIPSRFLPKIRKIYNEHYYYVTVYNGKKRVSFRTYTTLRNVKSYRTRWEKKGCRVTYYEKDYSLIEYKYPEALLSYLKQSDKISRANYMIDVTIKCFEKLSEKSDGLDFDKYIDNWTQRIIKENFQKV